MYKIILSSDIINLGADTVQMILRFEVGLNGNDVNYSFKDKGLRISRWGNPEIAYSLEDNNSAPKTYNFEIQENAQRTLDNLLFGKDGIYPFVTKTFEVELLINGNSEFIGNVSEDGIRNDEPFTFSFSADPNAVALKQVIINASEDEGVKAGDIVAAISTPFGDKPYVTLTTQYPHDLKTGDSIYIYNLKGFNQGVNINQNHYNIEVIDDTRFKVFILIYGSYQSGGTVLKKAYRNPLGYPEGYVNLAQTIIDVYNRAFPEATIDINQDWAFWGSDGTNIRNDIQFSDLAVSSKNMFFSSDYGINNLNDLIKHLAREYGCYTGIIHKKKAFFKRLFHFDSDNLQTLGEVDFHGKSYQSSLIDYMRVASNIGRELVYKRGYYASMEDRKIEHTLLSAFFSGQSSPPYDGSNVYTTTGGYQIFKVKDSALLGGQFTDMGNLVAEFWYNLLSSIINCRIDTFKVRGIGYDYLKNFVFEGLKYQPLTMSKDIANIKTKIEALCLGAL